MVSLLVRQTGEAEPSHLCGHKLFEYSTFLDLFHCFNVQMQKTNETHYWLMVKPISITY